MYKEFTVKYLLNGDKVERLKKITELINEQNHGKEMTVEETFEWLMLDGFARNINDKLEYVERKLGIEN